MSRIMCTDVVLLELLLLFSMTKYVTADILSDIIRSSFPPLKRCLQVLAMSNDTYLHLTAVLNSDTYPVVSTVSLIPDGNYNSLNCDDYVSECHNEDELKEFIDFLRECAGDVRYHQRKRFLIIMHDLPYTSKNRSDFARKIKQIHLNIMIIKQFSNKQHSSPSDSGSSANININGSTIVYAPIIGHQLTMNLSHYTPGLMEGLFMKQKKLLDIYMIQSQVLRISLFECPPFVIYLENGGIDGIEYRIMKEIASAKKVQVSRRDFSENITDPWGTVKSDIMKNVSDVAMCSIWLTRTNWSILDFSQQYNSLCSTYLVPKPTLANPSEYLYLPLSKLVWIGLFISLIVIMTWLYVVASSDYLFCDATCNTRQYTSVIYCFMRVIEMATQHGINIIPRQESIKIMITFWMVACILLSTAYSSGYTSLLTCPQYGRSIETLEDMVEAGLYWGDLQSNAHMDWTSNEYYATIVKRRRQKKSVADLMRSIEGNDHAIFVKRLGDNYVTDTEKLLHASKYLSCLRECVTENFIVFAVQKNSYYKGIINDRLIKLVEAGIVRHWQTDIIGKYKTTYMHRFFDHLKNVKNEPFALTVSHTRGAFYLLLGGLSLAIVIFFNEALRAVRFRAVRLISVRDDF